MGLNPARAELEILPGREKTTAFEIESSPSDVTVRGRLLLSLTDWDVDEDGSLRYAAPGALSRSASSWVVFSPSALTIASGETHQVRVTVRPPVNAAPGVYRTALFVQERPPAAPAGKGQHVFYVRLRYVFTLYVIVPPVLKHAEITEVRVVEKGQNAQVLWEMKNAGTGHVRPIVSVSIRDAQRSEIFRLDRHESIVLLPGNSLKQSLPIPLPAPGEYEVKVQADFQDGSALQSLSRTVRVNGALEGADF
jgi:hypothetical protein